MPADVPLGRCRSVCDKSVGGTWDAAGRWRGTHLEDVISEYGLCFDIGTIYWALEGRQRGFYSAFQLMEFALRSVFFPNPN